MNSSKQLRHLHEIRARFQDAIDHDTLLRFLRQARLQQKEAGRDQGRDWLWSRIYIYGKDPYNDGNQYLPLQTALTQSLLAVNRAEAKTWGEFVARCDPDNAVRQAIAEYLEDSTSEGFLDDDEFDPDYLLEWNAYQNLDVGIFWPEQYIIGELPGNIEGQYCRVDDTLFDGPTTFFDERFEGLILEAFADAGCLILRDEILIDACNLDWRDPQAVRDRVARYEMAAECLASVAPDTLRTWQEELNLPVAEPVAPLPLGQLVLDCDPWLQQTQAEQEVPSCALFLLAYEPSAMGLAEYPEAVFFLRTDGHDELWVMRQDLHFSRYPSEQWTLAHEFRYNNARPTEGRVMRAVLDGSTTEGMHRLLTIYLGEVAGLCHLGECLEPGLVEEYTYCDIVADIRHRWQQKVAAAKAARALNGSPLLDLATELGLNVEPAGEGEHAWYASCPGRNHQLMICSRSNQFGCGYCKVKGGEQELRDLVAARRRKVKE